jgi:hypothetical protein
VRASYWFDYGWRQVSSGGCMKLMSRYDDARLLGVAKLVAEVFIKVGEKDLRVVPAPEGVVHLRP